MEHGGFTLCASGKARNIRAALEQARDEAFAGHSEAAAVEEREFSWGEGVEEQMTLAFDAAATVAARLPARSNVEAEVSAQVRLANEESVVQISVRVRALA